MLEVLQALVPRYLRLGFWKNFKLRRRQYAWNQKCAYGIYRALGLNQKRRGNDMSHNGCDTPCGCQCSPTSSGRRPS